METKPVQEEEEDISYETLFGGTPINVNVAVHEAKRFERQTAYIRQLPIACYQKAFAIHENEEEMVALYVDKPIEWVKDLSPRSYNRIAEEGRRLNADFFVYCDRRAKLQMEGTRRVAPEMYAEIVKAATAAAAKSRLPS